MELVDWGDNDGADDIEVASPVTSDALDRKEIADPGAGCTVPRSGTSLALGACRSNGSPAAATDEPPAAADDGSTAVLLGAPAHGDAKAPAKLKSVLVLPTTPSSPGMLVWQPMDRRGPSAAGSLGSMVPHPAAPATTTGNSLYSGIGSCWEPGEPSGVKEMQNNLPSPD